MQKGTDYDWQQMAFKVAVLHAFLTTRLPRLWNNLLTWSLKAKIKFLVKYMLKKKLQIPHRGY